VVEGERVQHGAQDVALAQHRRHRRCGQAQGDAVVLEVSVVNQHQRCGAKRGQGLHVPQARAQRAWLEHHGGERPRDVSAAALRVQRA
jgi:hypothetical protein